MFRDHGSGSVCFYTDNQAACFRGCDCGSSPGGSVLLDFGKDRNMEEIV